MIEENEIQATRRLLSEIAEMCEHATLTGSLEGGELRTAQRYNAILQRLIATQVVPVGLFSNLPDSVRFGEIGVEAKMLASYLPSSKHKEKDSADRNVIIRLAPFVHKEELALLIRDHARNGHGLDINTLSSLAPFLGQDMLSELLRDHHAKTVAEPSAPKPPEEPIGTAKPPMPPSSIALAVVPEYQPEPTDRKQETIEDLLALLKSPYLSEEEKSQVIERLRAATGR